MKEPLAGPEAGKRGLMFATGLPSHRPAACEYSPQWMNMPNLASLNHSAFCGSNFKETSEAAFLWEQPVVPATSKAHKIMTVFFI